MKCENCNEEKEITEIKNYVVEYQSWEAYNCCCKECAIRRAKQELGLRDDDILSVE